MQVVVALLAIHILLNLRLNLVFELDQLLLANQNLQQTASTRQQTGCFEQVLTIGVAHLDVRADEVDDTTARIDILDCESCLLGHNGRDVDDVQSHVADRLHQSVELDVRLIGRRIANRGYCRTEIGLGLLIFAHLDLLQTVQDDGQSLIGHFENFENTRCRTHLIHIVRGRGLDLGFALQNGTEHTARGVHFAHEFDTLFASDRNGGNCAGEEHRTAQCQNGQHVGYRALLGRNVIARDDRNDLCLTIREVDTGQIF